MAQRQEYKVSTCERVLSIVSLDPLITVREFDVILARWIPYNAMYNPGRYVDRIVTTLDGKRAERHAHETARNLRSKDDRQLSKIWRDAKVNG